VLTVREGFYDEMLDESGAPRAHARTPVDALGALGRARNRHLAALSRLAGPANRGWVGGGDACGAADHERGAFASISATSKRHARVRGAK
jgi:hypothetical protein